MAGAGTAGGGDVRWPELLEKFRQTQEKARRRNERLLRGGGGGAQNGVEHDDTHTPGDVRGGTGAARRSLLDLHVDTQHNNQTGLPGRLARGGVGTGSGGGAGGRADAERAQFSAGLRNNNNNRPSSGLGKPLPLRPDSRNSGGHFGRNSVDTSRPGVMHNELGDAGSRVSGLNSAAAAGGGGGGGNGSGAAAGGGGGDNSKGQKSRHSLAGNLGKFASGIGRAGSRDKDRDKDRDKERRDKDKDKEREGRR